MLTFTQLNIGWNAEPNAPGLKLTHHADCFAMTIKPNAYLFPKFERVAIISVRFYDCRKYRVTNVNDHGWYAGQCRFSKLAPDWGEFYEISGDTRDEMDTTPWVMLSGSGSRHFHFYLRDNAVEVKAGSWSMCS